MTDFKKLLMFLSQFDLSCSKLNQIIKFVGEEASLKSFCAAKFDEKVLTKEAHEKMKVIAIEEMVDNYCRKMANMDIIILTKYDDEYPERLKGYEDAPFFLFCKGDIALLKSKTLSIVGTRKPTNYGRLVTDMLTREVAMAGVTIVSGLAYGIDSISHRKCLEVGGKTIAVLGGGFNYIYPTEHVSLAEEIAKKGLLVSEYSPNKKATKYSFPQRNRIIAGLGDGVLITEASFKSGTIHTKDFALEYGKGLYAVPGNINSELSALTNDLIKSGQADCVTSSKDILKDYKLKRETKEKKEKNLSLSNEEQLIVDILSKGMKEIDEISKESEININLLNSCLTTLEISGIICRLPGNFIALI